MSFFLFVTRFVLYSDGCTCKSHRCLICNCERERAAIFSMSAENYNVWLSVVDSLLSLHRTHNTTHHAHNTTHQAHITHTSRTHNTHTTHKARCVTQHTAQHTLFLAINTTPHRSEGGACDSTRVLEEFREKLRSIRRRQSSRSETAEKN